MSPDVSPVVARLRRPHEQDRTGGARLGGYGLWDASSSRYNNNESIENRAAYLFDANLTLAADKTLRVFLATAARCGTRGGW